MERVQEFHRVQRTGFLLYLLPVALFCSQDSEGEKIKTPLREEATFYSGTARLERRPVASRF